MESNQNVQVIVLMILICSVTQGNINTEIVS